MVTGWEYIESIEWQCNQEVFPINLLPSSYPAVKLDFSNLNCIGKIEINNSGAESLELNFGNKEIKIFDEIKVVSGGELKLIIHDVMSFAKLNTPPHRQAKYSTYANTFPFFCHPPF